MITTPDRSIADEIEAFRDALPYRPETLAVCGRLARKLYEQRHALWPLGVPVDVEANDGAWFAGNISSTLTATANLYRMAEGDEAARRRVAGAHGVGPGVDRRFPNRAGARLDGWSDAANGRASMT